MSRTSILTKAVDKLTQNAPSVAMLIHKSGVEVLEGEISIKQAMSAAAGLAKALRRLGVMFAFNVEVFHTTPEHPETELRQVFAMPKAKLQEPKQAPAILRGAQR